nr:dedicator of cytokinesis protein 9-like [Ciona intestinalis]|eukprot:XP_026695350.1 dedicator of cytokinesis protein 9-like [Ciona intestinalis]
MLLIMKHFLPEVFNPPSQPYGCVQYITTAVVGKGTTIVQLATVANLPHRYTGNRLFLARRRTHGSEVKWVDGGKSLYRVELSLVSTIYTDDQHIHNFFEASQRFSTSSSEQDMIKYLKTLLAAGHSSMVRYLPTILNRLLYLLTHEGFTADGHTNCMKTLIHVVATYHDTGHDKLLQQYIKYMFVTAPWANYKCKTIHEELATGMQSLLRPSTADFLSANKLLLHSSFFFQIIGKSMAQHLIQANKLSQSRSERFPLSFQHSVQSLLTTTTTHIVKKWKTNYSDVHNANLSLANFVKTCFTYLDRGFVFKLVNFYMENFNPGDAKVLFELKFEFLQIVCSHEHFIPLNLPFACSSKSARNADTVRINKGGQKVRLRTKRGLMQP